MPILRIVLLKIKAVVVISILAEVIPEFGNGGGQAGGGGADIRTKNRGKRVQLLETLKIIPQNTYPCSPNGRIRIVSR